MLQLLRWHVHPKQVPNDAVWWSAGFGVRSKPQVSFRNCTISLPYLDYDLCQACTPFNYSTIQMEHRNSSTFPRISLLQLSRGAPCTFAGKSPRTRGFSLWSIFRLSGASRRYIFNLTGQRPRPLARCTAKHRVIVPVRSMPPLHPHITVWQRVTVFIGKADHGNYFMKSNWEFCQAHFWFIIPSIINGLKKV